MRGLQKSLAVQSGLDAICRGSWRSAERALAQGNPDDWCNDAFHMNLLGVCAEHHGDYDRAKHFYGAAIRVDRHFEPAQQNMRRVFELFHFGESQEPYAVGDPLVDLLLASGHLGASGTNHRSVRRS